MVIRLCEMRSFFAQISGGISSAFHGTGEQNLQLGHGCANPMGAPAWLQVSAAPARRSRVLLADNSVLDRPLVVRLGARALFADGGAALSRFPSGAATTGCAAGRAEK
jgi:hypothetical protein